MTATKGIVLIHGGYHGAWAWDRLLPELELPALAVDLPGRGSRPADLDTVSIGTSARSVAADAAAAGLGQVVLVGHSLAGVLLPVIAAKLIAGGIDVAHLVFVASLVAEEGRSSLQSMPEALQDRAGERLKEMGGASSTIDMAHHRDQLCNDMTPEQESFTLSRLVPDTLNFFRETVDWGSAAALPRTYVRLEQDRSLEPEMQDHMIGLLGPTAVVEEINAGHNVMISDPPRLAAALNRIAREAFANGGS